MAPKLPKKLHFLAWQVEGQWVVKCLDFSLGAQASTMEAAHRRVVAHVQSYVAEALSMDGGIHASQLLNRRAPLSDWLLFRLAIGLRAVHVAGGSMSGYQRRFRLQGA